MSPELTALALAILLQAIQMIALAIPANLELGSGYTTGPRDEDPPQPLSRRTARTKRAMENHFEALILFSAAVLVVTASGQSSWFTALCAWIYLVARVAYIPAYIRGWAPWRSVIWAAGFFATMLMTLAALL